MQEANTLSAAVDDVIARSGRPDRQADIVAYVRSSVRECQVLSYFRNDLVEDTIFATSDVLIWEYPQEFRLLRTVRYPYFDLHGKRIYPKESSPGRMQADLDYFYYGGAGYYTFAGVANGAALDIAYYKNSKKIPYYKADLRPAKFDIETDSWSYLTATSEAEKLIARERVSNWLLFNYYDTILEGALAKVFKTTGDKRAGSTFALYKSLQKDLIANEPSDSLNK